MSAVHAPSNHIRGAVGNVMRPALEYLIAFVPSQQGLIYGYQNSAVTNLCRNHRVFVGRARDAVRSRHCEAHALVVGDETISQRQIEHHSRHGPCRGTPRRTSVILEYRIPHTTTRRLARSPAYFTSSVSLVYSA